MTDGDVTDAEACGSCRYWHPGWKFKSHQRYHPEENRLDLTNPRSTESMRKISEKGLCRRYAPQASALTTVWMETKSSDWCGDYTRNPD